MNIDDPKDKNSTEASHSNIFNSSSNNQATSSNKSDGNELSFLDSFFGEKQTLSSSNKAISPNLNNFNNESNKGSDIDFITKSLEEATKKSNDKPKSIFDGIEAKNKSQSNNNIHNSSQENKFKLNKPSNNQEKKSDLAGFNFDFNNNSNKDPNNNISPFNFNAAPNKPANNILDSLLNDLPQVNNNNRNEQNNNNVFNNFGSSNNLGFGTSASSQNKNVALNDEYDLDFLKPSINKNKSNTDNNLFNMGNNTQNNNANNFDFSSFGKNSNSQQANNNMNSLNFNNNNNMNSNNFNNYNNYMNSNNLGSLFPNQPQNSLNNNFNMNMSNSNNPNNNLFNFSNNFGNAMNNQNNNNLNKNNKSDNLFDGLLNM